MDGPRCSWRHDDGAPCEKPATWARENAEGEWPLCAFHMARLRLKVSDELARLEYGTETKRVTGAAA
jgi:hypothetical protein